MDTEEDSTPTPRPEEVAAAYEQGLAALRQTERSFALIGGIALQGYGEPRITKDVDFLVFGPASRWTGLRRRLEALGLKLDDRWHRTHPAADRLLYRFKQGPVRIDILRPADRHESGLRRRTIPSRVLGRPCPLLEPEDYILLKAKAERPQDFADAIAVARVYLDKLDYAYLRRWSIKVGRFEEIQYIVVQAERGDFAR